MKIAVVGAMGSGKDTMADILTREYGFTRVAFGDAVRDVAKKLFPKQYKENPRETLQWVGKTMREADPNVWINQTDTKIGLVNATSQLRYNKDADIILTDCRYPNELDFLKRNGFTIVQILVPFADLIQRNKARTDRHFKVEQLNHESESMALTGRVGDYYIYNDSDLETFTQYVRDFIEEMIENEQ